MSDDGRTIAIGTSSRWNGYGGYTCHTKIFTYDESVSNWAQFVGQEIDGEADDDCFLFDISVSLSANGRTVAIGAAHNAANVLGSDSGHTRIFTYSDNENSWIQLGQDIDGELDNDLSGSSVSLSSDGRTIAIGAPNNARSGVYSGHARVFTNIVT